MAVDMLVDSAQLDADLTSVANAIRSKGGTSASLEFPTDFVSAISNIPSGGGNPGNIIDYIQFTPASNGTYSQRVTVQLTPNNSCILAALIHGTPVVDPDMSLALAYIVHCDYMNSSNTSYGVAFILRANGTLGTDRTMGTFDKTSGILSLGGQYGVFKAGVTYDIYQIAIDLGV